MRAVNLLPLDSRQAKSIRQEDPAVVVGAALGVSVLIALGAGFMTAHNKAGAQQTRLDAARQELALLSLKNKTQHEPTTPAKPVLTVPIVPPPAVTQQQASWTAAVGNALSQRIAFDRVLREVSLVMPDDVTLTTMTLTAPASGTVATAAPAQGFVIAGNAYSYDSVARLLSRLALVPDLSNVTLTNSTQGESSTVTFNISAALKGGAAPAPAPAPAPASTTTTAAPES